MCEQKFEKSLAYKHHLFWHHTDIEAHAIFNCSLEELIGKDKLARFRPTLITKITRNQFDEEVRKLCLIEPTYRPKKSNKYIPKMGDLDPENKQIRISIYQKKRELLLKLAPDIPQSSEIVNVKYPHQAYQDTTYSVTWELSRSFLHQFIPGDIATSIMASQRFK